MWVTLENNPGKSTTRGAEVVQTLSVSRITPSRRDTKGRVYEVTADRSDFWRVKLILERLFLGRDIQRNAFDPKDFVYFHEKVLKVKEGRLAI